MAQTITAGKIGIYVKDDDNTVSSFFVPYANKTQTLWLETKEKPQVEDTNDKIHLNFIQQRMLDRLYKGLQLFTEDELKSLSKPIKERIEENKRKAKYIVHTMKVDKYYALENKLLNAIFKKDLGTKVLDYNVFVDEASNASLKSLNISKKDIIQKFIEHGLLPSDFYNVSTNSVDLNKL